MTEVTLTAASEKFPIAGTFTISRGSKREAVVVVAEVCDGTHVGRGEAVPYARYGETVKGTLATIRALGAKIPLDRAWLTAALPPGAARNAVDCALVDLEARRRGISAAALLGLPEPAPVTTCVTLSLDRPEEMADEARRHADFPLLKLKLGGNGDYARMAAVRAARPDARLVVDANEAWTPDLLEPLLAGAAAARIELIEQPLPAGADEALESCRHLVPICADESFHTAADLDRLARRYDAVNIKLDKTGGMTAAIDTVAAARQRGMRIMLGCMVATSLSMAPALLLAGAADWVDLDGPLLLARDRPGGLVYGAGTVAPGPPGLWG
jgi:L-alanine-DL-glutamate epimerase-like enolase superfamily enzyme